MTWQIGEDIGPYHLTDQIGSGGMATVYKAYQRRLERHVAIKVMHRALLEEPNFGARFEREARIIARLDHPNIVPIYDFAEHDGLPYLVMKHIEGRTLKQVLFKETMDSDTILKLMSPIAAALSYAHEQGVLHRDIKPSNIIIDSRGHAYLTDFGLARLTQAGITTMSVDMTMGTPYYISPEQARGETNLDARTDVYSLGIVLYEMVTGRVPFMAESSYAVIHDHIYTPPPLPRDINPDISDEVEAVLLKAIAKTPAERHESANALIQDFRRAVAASPPEVAEARESAHTEPESPRPERPRREPAFTPGIPPADASVVRPQEASAAPIKGKNEEEQPTTPAEAELTFEERIRNRAEERVKGRRSALQEIGSSIFFFLLVNFGIFNADEWLSSMIDNGRLESPDFILWFTFIFWGMGIIGQLASYYSNYGPGQKEIDREIEREYQRLYGSSVEKTKNIPDYDYEERSVRLTDEGELTESFVEEWEQQKQKR